MADYSQIAQALNPWQQAGQQILANPIQAQGYRQGINQDDPWKLALANMAQGLIGGAMGQYGSTQAAEERARLVAQTRSAELEMMKQKALMERENKIAEAQALNPLEIEKFKAQEAYKMNNEVEKAKQLSPLEIQKEEAITSMRALADIRKHAANAGIDSQYAGANAGAAEEARLAAQAKYGALPNQGGKAKDLGLEEKLKGQSLLRVADNLEDAINKLESSKVPVAGAYGKLAGVLQENFPGNTPQAKAYQEGRATLSQSFPTLFSQYRVPGTGAMSDYETGLYERMLPKLGDSPAAMRQKLELIRQDAMTKMGQLPPAMLQAAPAQPQQAPAMMPQAQSQADPIAAAEARVRARMGNQ